MLSSCVEDITDPEGYQCLCNAGLQVSIKKCEFHIIHTKYLSFILTTEGIEVDLEKTAVI